MFGLLGTDDGGDDLGEVREAETVADVVDDRLRERLPPEWTVRPEVVQFGDRALSEVLVLSAGRGREYVLAPADTYDPTGETDLFVRVDGRRRSLGRAGSLSAAVDAVAARIDAPRGGPRRADAEASAARERRQTAPRG